MSKHAWQTKRITTNYTTIGSGSLSPCYTPPPLDLIVPIKAVAVNPVTLGTRLETTLFTALCMGTSKLPRWELSRPVVMQLHKYIMCAWVVLFQHREQTCQWCTYNLRPIILCAVIASAWAVAHYVCILVGVLHSSRTGTILNTAAGQSPERNEGSTWFPVYLGTMPEEVVRHSHMTSQKDYESH